jgi:hypothetical protein
MRHRLRCEAITSFLIGDTASLGFGGDFGSSQLGPQGLDSRPQMTVND